MLIVALISFPIGGRRIPDIVRRRPARKPERRRGSGRRYVVIEIIRPIRSAVSRNGARPIPAIGKNIVMRIPSRRSAIGYSSACGTKSAGGT